MDLGDLPYKELFWVGCCEEVFFVGGPIILYVVSNFNGGSSSCNGTVTVTGGPGLSGLVTRYPVACVNTSNLSINLPSNRVNGDRINRAGVNTNHVICRPLAEVAGTFRSNRTCGGGTLLSTIGGTGSNGTLRLVNLISPNNIRDRASRLCNLLRVTGGRNIRGICIRTILSNHSIPPTSTIRSLGTLRTGVDRVNINGVTSIVNEFCTVSHSGV